MIKNIARRSCSLWSIVTAPDRYSQKSAAAILWATFRAARRASNPGSGAALLWGFFQSDSQTKRSLFFKYRFRVKSGLGNANPASNFERAFGTVIPSSIPVRWGVVSNRCAAHNNGSVQESTAWWRRQGKELAVRAWVALRSCFRYRKLSMRARAAHESTNCMTAKRQIKIDR